MDFLLIELVPMAYRMAAELAAREEEYVTPGNPTVTAGRRASAVTITNGGTPKSGTTPRIPEGAAVGSAEEEDYKDAVLYRLETLGYRVGLGITERYVCFAARLGQARGHEVRTRDRAIEDEAQGCFAALILGNPLTIHLLLHMRRLSSYSIKLSATQSRTNISTASLATNRASAKPSMSSNFCAKTFGPLSSASKSII